MKRQSFIEGAAIMMCSAVFVKIVGALFKIPLSNILGGSGMGYFMGAYGLFNPIYAVTAAGLPSAVTAYLSRQISLGGDKYAKGIFSVCFYLFSVFGFVMSLLFWLFSKQLCDIMGNPEAYLAVRAISPCIFLCCINGALRGYFEGSRQMTPTALSQAAEVTAKLFLGIILANLALEKGLTEFFKYKTVFGEAVCNISEATEKIMPYAAEYSLLGVSMAAACGTMVMIFYYVCFNGLHTLKFEKKYVTHIIPILKIAIPISLSAFIVNLYPLIDMAVIVKAFRFVFKNIETAERYFPELHGKFDSCNAMGNYIYGCYSGIAMTIFHLIPALTASLSTAALPLISSLSVKDDKKRLGDTSHAVMRLSALFSFPAGMGLFIMSEPVLTFLFKNSPDEVITAAPMLSVLGLAAIFVGISAPAFAILQGMGKPFTPTFIIAFFTGIKLLLNIFLLSFKNINVMAAPISTLICYFFIAFFALKNISLGTLKKITLTEICLKPFILCLICCPLCKITYVYLLLNSSQSVSLTVSIGITGIIYILFLQLSGEFKQHYIKILRRNKKS